MESGPVLIPIRTPAARAPYISGKRNLARAVIDRLSAIPHEIYVEPFVGIGGCSFEARERSPSGSAGRLSIGFDPGLFPLPDGNGYASGAFWLRLWPSYGRTLAVAMNGCGI
jgi:hypothetical protein